MIKSKLQTCKWWLMTEDNMSAEGSSSKHPGQEERRGKHGIQTTTVKPEHQAQSPAEGWGHPHTCPGRRGGPAQAPSKEEEMKALCREDIIKGLCMQRREPEAQSPLPRKQALEQPSCSAVGEHAWPGDADWESRRGSDPGSRSQLPHSRPELWKSLSQ